MQDYKEYFKNMVWFEVSDISFTQHYKNKNMMNTVILSVQLLALIVGVVFGVVFNVNPFKLLAVLNLIMLVFILANDYICDITWTEAKNRRDDLMAIVDLVDDEMFTEEDIQLVISAIKGFKIVHSDLVLSKLVYKWFGNLSNTKRERTGYRDSSGVEYCVGDIVFNDTVGDIWYVDKLSPDEMKGSSFTNPYVYKLYGNDEEYMMEIDESRFDVLYTVKDRKNYIHSLITFIKMYKIYNRESIDINCEEVLNDEEVD